MNSFGESLLFARKLCKKKKDQTRIIWTFHAKNMDKEKPLKLQIKNANHTHI